MFRPTVVSLQLNNCEWFNTYCQGVSAIDHIEFHRPCLTLCKHNQRHHIHRGYCAFNRARKIGEGRLGCFPVLASNEDVRRVVHGNC